MLAWLVVFITMNIYRKFDIYMDVLLQNYMSVDFPVFHLLVFNSQYIVVVCCWSAWRRVTAWTRRVGLTSQRRAPQWLRKWSSLWRGSWTRCARTAAWRRTTSSLSTRWSPVCGSLTTSPHVNPVIMMTWVAYLFKSDCYNIYWSYCIPLFRCCGNAHWNPWSSQ